MANYRLLVDFDEGPQVVYDVAEDIREIAAFAELKTLPGLFESAHLDSSRTSVVWNDRIDLPSDTIREYGGEVPETPKAGEFAAAGMWADREDLADPTAYVRKLRSRRAFA